MKLQITPKIVAFVVIVGILAWFLFMADIQETREKLALQRTQLVDSECMYFDGFTECTVENKYCTLDGKIKPISFGLCEDLQGPNYNRAAIGDACTTDAECDTDEYCDGTSCQECTRDSHCPSGTPLCYNNVCVECEQDSDCASDEVCSNNVCIDQDTAEEEDVTEGECTTSADCADDEYCYDNDCVDAENPTQWSTAEFNNTVLDEMGEDFTEIVDSVIISKKWAWYVLFIAGILLALGMILPKRPR